jgi:hypothetical protein
MWLVLKNKKTGELSVCSRRSRDIFLEDCLLRGKVVPTIVEKEFDYSEEATNYLVEMRKINEIIKSCLNKKD